MADWGFSHLPPITPEKAVDLGCGGGRNAGELLKKYPERKFIVVDTLSISTPQALLVLKAHELYRAGKPIEEVGAWLENNKMRAQAWFAVDDLKYLKRGGRVSPAAAAFGTMLDIKPVLTEARDGTLVPVEKVRGKKKAINLLLDKLVENTPDPEESMAIVLNADVPEEAEQLRKAAEERIPGLKVRVANIGPVIGAHCGPGTLAITFLGKERKI